MKRTPSLAALLAFLALAPAWALPKENLSQVELYLLNRKYEGLPLEARVGQLERFLGQPAPAGASLDYRVNRLLAVAGLQVSEDALAQAIRAYNRGVELVEAGRVNEAMTFYRMALQANPRLVEAYNNLGNLLEQSGRYAEALENYQLAVYYSPRNALLHKNLGVLYQRLGKVPEAMQAYRQYIDLLAPGGADPAVAGMLAEYENNRKLASRDVDYFPVVTSSSKGHLLAWPDFLNPVPVYVSLETPEQAIFLPMVIDSMNAWEQATGARLRFRQTTRPEEARIRVLLTPGPLADPYLDVGHAHFYTRSDRNIFKTLRVDIRINTGKADTPPPAREAQVRRLVLHELGHAIGIWGHSNNPDDIMYTHPIAPGLSPRDIRTVQKLYAGELSSQEN